MALSAAQQARAIREFLNAGVRELESASKVVVRRAALQLRSGVQREMRRNFKGSAQFAKGIKVYNLPPNGGLGPASYVRLGRIQSQFQEPTTLVGRRNLVILLPPGKALGFERISRRNTWENLINTWGNRLVFKKSGQTVTVLFRSQNGLTPIYKLQKQVTTTKRLTFLEQSDQIGDKLDQDIDTVLRS